jgi:hypothetical protein
MERIKILFKWIATDGLLHILVCYSMMLALTPMIGIWLAMLMAMVVSAIKEAYDYCIQKDNNREQVIHDAACDVVGMFSAIITMLFW